MIDIVVVNWNSGRQLGNLLRSIQMHHGGIVGHVVVVDNASSDDSLVGVEDLEDAAYQLKIVRNERNRGFGFACNQGAALGCSDYILFLNPDAELYEESLSRAMAFMEHPENENVGVCGVQMIDGNKRVARSCGRFITPLMFLVMALGLDRLPMLTHFQHHMTDWNHATTRDVDHVIGAFYFIRRKLFDSLNGFDERFFVYFEDLDLSLRVRKSGRRIVYLADAQAFHAGGGTSSQVKAIRLFYVLRSRIFYAFKHFSTIAAWSVVGITLFVEPLPRLLVSFLRGGVSDMRNTVSGYRMVLRALPSILRDAKQ